MAGWLYLYIFRCASLFLFVFSASQRAMEFGTVGKGGLMTRSNARPNRIKNFSGGQVEEGVFFELEEKDSIGLSCNR